METEERVDIGAEVERWKAYEAQHGVGSLYLETEIKGVDRH